MNDDPQRYPPHPTRTDAERLIAWLPILYAPDFRIEVPRPEGPGPWYPEYTTEVKEFYRELAGAGWVDYGYDRIEAHTMLTPERVATATLPEVRSMLTLILRSERFGDGNRGGAISRGMVRWLLERVEVLIGEGVFPEEGGD